MRRTHPRRHSIPAWLLPSLLLSVILSASSLGHAQCYEPPANQAPQVTLSPTYWAPGQTYTVTLSDPQGYFVPYTPRPGFLPATLYVLTTASYDAGAYTTEDPNVTVTNLTLVNSSTITFTATVLGSAPVEADGFGLVCLGYKMTGGPGTIEITPCALPVTPTVSSIVPAAFFAGTSTSVTITGIGFISYGNTYGCSPTQLSITAGTETVSLSNLNVASSTQITATVAPQATDPDVTATVTATNLLLNGPPNSVSATTTAEVLPVPVIQWGSATISGASATNPNPTAVVGNPVNLTIQAASIPTSVSHTSDTWTAGGTNIGAYTPTASSYDTGSVTATTLAGLSLNTYWVYSGKKIPATYTYCAQISGSQYCSPAASAAFTVTGPPNLAMSGMGFSGGLTIQDWTQVNAACITPGIYLVYGNIGITYSGGKCSFSNTAGMTFEPSGSSTGGTFFYVQAVTGGSTSGSINCTNTPTPGLDTEYPYPFFKTGTSDAVDSPATPVNTSGASVSRSEQFAMYLMWTSSIASSIPVPIGFEDWGFSGSASCKSSCNAATSWKAATIASATGTTGGYQKSAASQPNYGYPTWSGLVDCK